MIEKATLHLNRSSHFTPEEGVKMETMSPKTLLLCAGAKCAGMMALSIMEKEQVHPKRFEISMSGELSTPTMQPTTVFTSFHMVYNVECATEEDQVKVSRAIQLTHEKYCSMLRMLRHIAPVSHEIAIVSTEPVKA